MNSVVTTNILLPSASGLVLLLFSVYFFSIKKESNSHSRAYAWFLLSFSLFLIGRPVQIFSGEHPLPLSINNIRVFVLCSVTMPALIEATGLYPMKSSAFRRVIAISTGVFLGTVYVFFHSKGTLQTYEIFRIGSMPAYASIAPLKLAPWYGREISIAVQCLVGIILAVGSVIKSVEIIKGMRKGGKVDRHIILIYFGVLIFGLSFASGSVLFRWSVYYAGAVISSVLIGSGVFMDIKKMSRQIQSFVPFVKEDILRFITFFEGSEENTKTAISLLGKKVPDCFMLLRFGDSTIGESEIQMHDNVQNQVSGYLDKVFDSEKYITFPLSRSLIGIAFSSEGKDQRGLISISENLRDILSPGIAGKLSIGIGRSGNGIRNLRVSYSEAVNALEFAEKHGENVIIHIDNINDPLPESAKYPHQEKESLLLCIRLGDQLNAEEKASGYFDSLAAYIGGSMTKLRMRFYDIAGSIFDAAVSGGANNRKTEDLNSRAYDEISSLNNFDAFRKWLIVFARETAVAVIEAEKGRTARYVQKTKEYVEKNYKNQINAEDVSGSLFISTSYFIHLFKEKSGKTLSEYVAEVRLTKAKELLLKSAETITAIAFEVGFNDSNYFSTVFRNHEGISPSEYRKKNQSGS